MSTPQTTIDAILDGAVRALARHGLRRLSMSDICAEAGVSRGTLYRYFKSKEDILEAVNRRIEDDMRASFDKALEENDDPADRLRVILGVMIRTPERYPHMLQIVELEPGSALGFLTRETPKIVRIVAEYLEPVLSTAPPIVQGLMTEQQLAEIFQRLITSTFLIPSPGSTKLDSRIADMCESFTAATNQSRPKRARGKSSARAAR
jgi:AcrR family transcriptional regulator